MALVILDKYGTDPEFREILRTVGPAVIPPIAQADTSPEALALLQSKEHRASPNPWPSSRSWLRETTARPSSG